MKWDKTHHLCKYFLPVYVRKVYVSIFPHHPCQMILNSSYNSHSTRFVTWKNGSNQFNQHVYSKLFYNVANPFHAVILCVIFVFTGSERIRKPLLCIILLRKDKSTVLKYFSCHHSHILAKGYFLQCSSINVQS